MKSKKHLKRRPLETDRDYELRRNASERERSRMKDMNRAFDRLRTKLLQRGGGQAGSKRISKIQALRLAIHYIIDLESTLYPEDQQDCLADPQCACCPSRQRILYGTQRGGNQMVNSGDSAVKTLVKTGETGVQQDVMTACEGMSQYEPNTASYEMVKTGEEKMYNDALKPDLSHCGMVGYGDCGDGDASYWRQTDLYDFGPI